MRTRGLVTFVCWQLKGSHTLTLSMAEIGQVKNRQNMLEVPNNPPKRLKVDESSDLPDGTHASLAKPQDKDVSEVS